jgi:hypothetical protein
MPLLNGDFVTARFSQLVSSSRKNLETEPLSSQMRVRWRRSAMRAAFRS